MVGAKVVDLVVRWRAQGAQAQREGRDFNVNPYPSGSAAAEAWFTGWCWSAEAAIGLARWRSR